MWRWTLEEVTAHLEYLEQHKKFNYFESSSSFLEDISLDLTYKMAKFIYRDLINEVVLFSKRDINFVAHLIPFI